jgi:cytochrome c553
MDSYHAKSGMSERTTAQRVAAERDGRWCLWHLQSGVLQPIMEVHHIFGRARSDEEQTCIGLCHECHQRHHDGRSPTTVELLELMRKVYGYDYSQYRQFTKRYPE